ATPGATRRRPRRQRSHGVLLPEQRRERPLLRRRDRTRDLPRPAGLGGAAAAARHPLVKHECDVLIVGGGITAALLAERLSERNPSRQITVVEAGARLFDFENRMQYRQRMLEYGENPWRGDFIKDQAADGIIARSMAVGGQALHWGGVTNRFSEEDLV